MTGLDHKKAELFIREKFTLTKENIKIFLKKFTSQNKIGGCVLLSTCNRTELYVSIDETDDIDLTRLLCDFLHLEYDEYYKYFIERKSHDAIIHLFKVSAGMDSQILGDDQIITQVREDLELARSVSCSDSYLETCFKTAIKAGKKIKTEVVLRDPKTSNAPYKAIEKLKEYFSLSNKNILVIGNGHMGRIVSELLIKERANVTITLREYRKGTVYIPKWANTISYSDRRSILNLTDVVISATTSPHFTLKYNDLDLLERPPLFYVDLAVPRDLEPKIKEIPNTKLFTIDDLDDKNTIISSDKMNKINEIIDDSLKRYNKWQSYKEG